MPIVKLHTMDFTCECGAITSNVSVGNQFVCPDCGRRYLLSVLITREKDDQSGEEETEVLSPIDPPVADDGTDA